MLGAPICRARVVVRSFDAFIWECPDTVAEGGALVADSPVVLGLFVFSTVLARSCLDREGSRQPWLFLIQFSVC